MFQRVARPGRHYEILCLAGLDDPTHHDTGGQGQTCEECQLANVDHRFDILRQQQSFILCQSV